ncbi:MAG TPA: tetraacyldisaccharide 4'-kinase [Stellaceae bacterium]|nr:tetraacyldisaccharide 4'-kinase [Stellaceae bacterium]
MPPRAPEFWRRDGRAARLLAPLAAVYDAAVAARFAHAKPVRAGVPVICVGNLTLGGAGKTPIAIALAKRLAARGIEFHFLSRGYGGRFRGPLLVDAARHDARDVGDEALLLARVAPCWVARDRPAGARAAVKSGAQAILMDDGLQNPSLAKDWSLLVLDGGYGLGNGRVLPAGPLREQAARGLARADAVVIMGEDETGLAGLCAGKTVLSARLAPVDPAKFRDRAVVAFAGIGRPEKFFRSAEEAGARLVIRRAFADHHRYHASELHQLMLLARGTKAALLTTEKDWVRLPLAWRAQVDFLPVEVEWREPATLDTLLDSVLKRAHG